MMRGWGWKLGGPPGRQSLLRIVYIISCPTLDEDAPVHNVHIELLGEYTLEFCGSSTCGRKGLPGCELIASKLCDVPCR